MLDDEVITQYYPGAQGMMIEPMLIHSSTNDQLKRACESDNYFGQFKKDGALYMFVKGANGECYLFGRTVSKKTGLLTEKINNVPHLIDAFHLLPNKTIILGELYYPGGSSRNTTEIMGCLPEKAVARQKEKGLIHYYIYDILMYDGIDFVKAQTSNWIRYQILTKVYNMYSLNLFENFIELAESWTDHLYERVGQALASGEEGMVIKLKSGIYEPGKRPLSNLKAKKIDYIDAVILGFEPPTKEYYGKDITNWPYWINEENQHIPVTKAWYNGWMNSRLQIGAYDKNNNLYSIGIISSGISDKMKEQMTNNPDDYLGKVVRIQCMEKDSQAKTLRHGFYLGLHEDKNPKECVLDNIFDNLEKF